MNYKGREKSSGLRAPDPVFGEVKVELDLFLLHSPLSVAPLGSLSSTSAPILAEASPWEATQGIGRLVSPVGSWGAQDA